MQDEFDEEDEEITHEMPWEERDQDDSHLVDEDIPLASELVEAFSFPITTAGAIQNPNTVATLMLQQGMIASKEYDQFCETKKILIF